MKSIYLNTHNNFQIWIHCFLQLSQMLSILIQILTDLQQQPTIEQIMGLGETTNELKVRIKLVTLLINPDLPTIATIGVILIALNKIKALE